MVLGNGFFTYSKSEAQKEMINLAGCEVRHCVFPTTGNLEYFISEHGDLFSIQIIQGRYLTRGPKKAGSLEGHGKRRDGGITHRLVYNPKCEKWIAAEKLVFCTFILGHWEEDIQIEFKNGNASDVRPDNLQPKKEKWLQEYTDRMYEYEHIYKHDFGQVARSIQWWCFLPIEDAKDIAQSTFIWLTTNGFKETFNTPIWIFWGRRRGMDFWNRVIRHFSDEDFQEFLFDGIEDPGYEVDLIHVQPGIKRAKYLMMWLQSHTPTEIAEECNSTISNVGSSVTRSIQFLRRYLRHERDLLR